MAIRSTAGVHMDSAERREDGGLAIDNMLTVSISVNGEPIYTRTVVNRIRETGGYICDDGSIIEHDPEDGAVKLAIKALETIHEVPDR